MECLLICFGVYFIQHMGSFNYGKIRTMGAVLVAISIPIFTGQLAKARLATNQANARAAYAEAAAALLLDEETTSTASSYTYDISKATAVKDETTVTEPSLKVSSSAIDTWTTETKIGETKLGSKTAKTWTIAFSATGEVIGFNATF